MRSSHVLVSLPQGSIWKSIKWLDELGMQTIEKVGGYTTVEHVEGPWVHVCTSTWLCWVTLA